MTGERSLELRLCAKRGRFELDVELRTPEDAEAGALVLLGPNGAGKTSLLSAVLGALRVSRGFISVASEVLLDTARGVNVPIEARRIGYVPQDYALFPHLSVRENVEFALATARPSLPRRERRRAALALLGEFGLSASAEQSPHSLSGGEQQRVALARALAVEPRALLLDEPLAALDVQSRREVRAFLAETLAKVALPTIVVTHDAEDARALGSRVAVMEAGRIVQTGSLEELAAAPRTAFVAAFVGA